MSHAAPSISANLCLFVLLPTSNIESINNTLYYLEEKKSKLQVIPNVTNQSDRQTGLVD